MAKFCKQCGNQIPDGAMFCRSCGTKVEEVNAQPECNNANDTCDCGCEQEQPKTYTQKGPNAIANFVNGFIGKVKSKDTTSIIILAAIPAVLIVGLVLALIFGGGGAENAIENYLAAAIEGDVSVTEDLAPESFWEWADDKYNKEIEDVEENLEDEIKPIKKVLEKKCGEDLSADYEITKEKELSEKKLKVIRDNLKNNYDIPKKDVTEAIEFEIDVTIEGDEDEETIEMKIIAVEIDGDWYPMLDNRTLAIAEFVGGYEIPGIGDLGDYDIPDIGDLGDYDISDIEDAYGDIYDIYG